MIRKYLLILIACFVVLTAGAQVKKSDPLTSLINSTLMRQVLDDFDQTVPLDLFTPGFYIIGGFRDNSNPSLSESDYFDNEELVRNPGYYKKEIYDVINADLIPYIPVDSAMSVRVIQNKKLLFELTFQNTGDTVIFNQVDAGKMKSKSVKMVNGKIIAVFYGDTGDGTSCNSLLYGDTLRISEYNDWNNRKTDKLEIRYNNGHPVSLSHFAKTPAGFELKSTDNYFYSSFNKPTLKQTIDRKGKLTDSTQYFYDGDKLIHSQKYSGPALKYSFTYVYNRTGALSEKTLTSVSRNYTMDYIYANGSISRMEIEEKTKSFTRRYVFKNSIQRKLLDIEYSSINKESLIETMKNRWLFEYNGKGNISMVKEMDDKGEVVNEITFGYDFFGNSL